VNDLKVTYRVNGGGANLPPQTFDYFFATDGTILMSDTPNCSEIYGRPDAVNIVAIT